MRGKAVVFPEVGVVAVQEIGLPSLGPDDVLVRIEYSMTKR